MGPVHLQAMGQNRSPDYPEHVERSKLTKLLSDASLYRSGRDYLELLEFVARFKSFAPFNAMLLHVQKPGLSFAASAKTWKQKFRRTIKPGARPLLVLQPFTPVALVYDVLDTAGERLPEGVQMFPASGPVNDDQLHRLRMTLLRNSIEWMDIDAGDASAGWIRVLEPCTKENPGYYLIAVNQNHPPPGRFATLMHELAHLFLGHLGGDRRLRIPDRQALCHARREIEAESTAFLLCERSGVTVRSDKYLASYVSGEQANAVPDLYQVMRAAGQIENALGLNCHSHV